MSEPEQVRAHRPRTWLSPERETLDDHVEILRAEQSDGSPSSIPPSMFDARLSVTVIEKTPCRNPH